MCIYVSEICASRIFVSCPWWLKNVESSSKIALFSSERHFKMCFPKIKTITFFWRKLSKLHKKDTILHVTITLFQNHGQTRTSSRPITLPLIQQDYPANLCNNEELPCMKLCMMLVSRHDGGAVALSKALKHMHFLRELDLCYNINPILSGTACTSWENWI